MTDDAAHSQTDPAGEATTSAVDVAVIGAGISGLIAARDLAAAGRRVAVLEARDRVGGRTYSVDLDGQKIDLGGQWLGATQHRLAALADELGVNSFAQHTAGRKILERDGARSTYSGFLPRLPIVDLVELGYRLARLERMARRVPLDVPVGASRAGAWDAETLAAWMTRHVRTKGARDMLGLAAQMIFAAEPRDFSFLYFLFYVHSGDGLKRLAESRNGAQERRFIGGAQQICERLAAEIGDRGGVVELASPVEAIEQDEDGVTVHTRAGRRRATRAVLAVPPALCDRIDFRPALEPRRAALHRGMPMGSVIKCVAAYERPFWREAGYSGEAFSTSGVVRAVFDDCAPSADHAALVAFVVGDAARALGERTPDERRERVLAELARHFGGQAGRPRAYVDKDWGADEWSAGCYVGLAPPGLLTEVGDALRRPSGRLHFAGTETAEHHVGYIDGGIEAGKRAAAEVLARLGARAGAVSRA